MLKVETAIYVTNIFKLISYMWGMTSKNIELFFCITWTWSVFWIYQWMERLVSPTSSIIIRIYFTFFVLILQKCQWITLIMHTSVHTPTFWGIMNDLLMATNIIGRWVPYVTLVEIYVRYIRHTMINMTISSYLDLDHWSGKLNFKKLKWKYLLYLLLFAVSSWLVLQLMTQKMQLFWNTRTIISVSMDISSRKWIWIP